MINAHYNIGEDNGRFIHGLSRLPEYAIWSSMKRRCDCPSRAGHKSYGGRGIVVCSRWSSFPLFFMDMGPRPGKEYSLDRINNDGNYEPSNCRWATIAQQANNKRRKAAHGSVSMYTNRNCRCERCRIAMRTYDAAKYRRNNSDPC